MAAPGVLALMGSGETSPTMVSAHRRLAALLGPSPRAVILQTPYGFQVNTEDLSRRAQEYFERSVGIATVIGPDPRAGDAADVQRACDQVRNADWVFSGPGSPSYALRIWNAPGGGVGCTVTERVMSGRGVTILASAAACTAGLAALPVYEVYKVGADPAWIDGLDVLGALDLPVAVIPHFDNAEGGTYDTRFCYLGEPRLAELERTLPAGAAVLGIDEHTAAVFDLARRTVQIWGRGGITVRRAGVSVVLPAGTDVPIAELRDLVHGRGSAARRSGTAAEGTGRGEDARAGEGLAPTLPEAVERARACFEEAVAAGDGPGAVAAILDLEAVIGDWAGDTEEDVGSAWARGALRELIERLGSPLSRGLAEPGRTLHTLVPPLLALRTGLRAREHFEAADELRVALMLAGVELRDSPEGTSWQLRSGFHADEPEGPAGDASVL